MTRLSTKKRPLIIFLAGLLLLTGFNTFAEDIQDREKYKDIKINPLGLTPSRECGKCHKDIYSAWKNSLHAASVTNSVFKTAYILASFEDSEKAKRKCLPCHAPIAVLSDDFGLKREISNEGVNCDYCHSISETFAEQNGPKNKFEFGLLKQGPLKDVESPVHKTRYNKLYTDSRFCASCHELKGDNGTPLIETWSEWKESPYPAKGIHCQNCHMRKVAGKVVPEEIKKTARQEISSHDIAGGHSLTMREKSVGIKISDVIKIRQKVTVTVEITNKGAGHKIPTGLPSKKIILEVSIRSEDGDVYQTQKKYYQKKIVNEKGEPMEDDSIILMLENGRVASDNRIKPMETRREKFMFFVPEGEKQIISAAVYYSHNPKIIAASPIHIKLKEIQRSLGP